MKPHEMIYLCAEPFLPFLYQRTRKQLIALAQSYSPECRMLDVGGRKSHYTIGVPASITITDLLRRTALQEQLHLGVNWQMVQQTRKRRTNMQHIVIDDMTQSAVVSSTFDCVVAVEVLEHVEADDLFLQEVARVLKPGGAFFMTTPNGDFVRNTNPDHIRHYRRHELLRLLAQYFAEVDLFYAVRSGKFYKRGLRPWSIRRPWRTALTMFSNVISSIQSAHPQVAYQSQGTQHLMAVAKKAPANTMPSPSACT